MCGIIGVFKSNPSTCDNEIIEGFDLLNKRGPDSSKYINTNTEGFTPKIRGLYRPYVRTINQGFENFVNNYGSKVIINKLRKWDIY